MNTEYCVPSVGNQCLQKHYKFDKTEYSVKINIKSKNLITRES